MATLPTYILITPARNEAQFIQLTLQSMVGQTYRPLKWIIVSDGSTDSTDDIVRKYAADNPWIELLRMPERAERHFAGKVHAFNAGYTPRAEGIEPGCDPGNLDADVSIGPDHFQYLSLSKFAENPGLGVGGIASSGKDRCSTTTAFQTLKMSGAAASCSGGNASTRLADIPPSKAAASTTLRSYPQE